VGVNGAGALQPGPNRPQHFRRSCLWWAGAWRLAPAPGGWSIASG